MINNPTKTFCTVIVASVVAVSLVWFLFSHLGIVESDDGVVIVDGSFLRVLDSEIIITNSLSLSVRPSHKVSEWIYVNGVGSEILVNGHRFEVSQAKLRHVYDRGIRCMEKVDEEIVCELPVLFRFFENKVIVAGSATWTKGSVVVDNVCDSYEVKVYAKKECRIVIKGNWYEFSG